MAPQRVLVVDADWRMRRLIHTNLEAQGLLVAEAASARECLEALQAESCDLLLLSADLPDDNGWNLVGALRRMPAVRSLPIVVIAAEPARHRLLLRFQSVNTLVKPFSAADLLDCVRRALDSGQ